MSGSRLCLGYRIPRARFLFELASIEHAVALGVHGAWLGYPTQDRAELGLCTYKFFDRICNYTVISNRRSIIRIFFFSGSKVCRVDDLHHSPTK